MRADGISIQDFFHTERRHVVPLYQRPYVWKREDQSEPLWDEAAISCRTDELLRIARAAWLRPVREDEEI